jgi:Fe-S oxidoreductase
MVALLHFITKTEFGVCSRNLELLETEGNTFWRVARELDLEKKMCCGFPFEADGLHERAKQSQILSLIEIAKCIAKLIEECQSKMVEVPKFIVFSNCPTCCEAIKEMKLLLKSETILEHIRIKAKLTDDFNMSEINFDIQDTAELAINLLKQSQQDQDQLLGDSN